MTVSNMVLTDNLSFDRYDVVVLGEHAVYRKKQYEEGPYERHHPEEVSVKYAIRELKEKHSISHVEKITCFDTGRTYLRFLATLSNDMKVPFTARVELDGQTIYRSELERVLLLIGITEKQNPVT